MSNAGAGGGAAADANADANTDADADTNAGTDADADADDAGNNGAARVRLNIAEKKQSFAASGGAAPCVCGTFRSSQKCEAPPHMVSRNPRLLMTRACWRSDGCSRGSPWTGFLNFGQIIYFQK